MARRQDPEVALRVAQIKMLLVIGWTPQGALAWCTTPQPRIEAADIPAKEWTVSRQQARKYVDLALEDLDAHDVVAKDRKRARNRGLHMLILQRLLAINTAQSLAAAGKIADQICKIDGSYDPASLGPSIGLPVPADDDEAADLIDHAAATLELARARGKHLPRRAQVIDVDPAEDAPDEAAPEPPTDAN